MALIYVERLLALHPAINLTLTNVHRLILAALVVSIKVFDDEHHSNAAYAQVGGVHVLELNALEAHLLVALQWRTYVSQEECHRCFEALRSYVGEGTQPVEPRPRAQSPKAPAQAPAQAVPPAQAPTTVLPQRCGGLGRLVGVFAASVWSRSRRRSTGRQ